MTISSTQDSASPQFSEKQPSLYRAVAAAAYRLQGSATDTAHRPSGASKAVLSRLRRAAGTEPGADPLAWSAIAEEVLGELPEEDIGRGDSPSDAEWAAYTAITLFAIHQQSHRQPMHVAGRSLGQAVAALQLITGSGSIKPRLDSVMLATTPAALRYHLRSLVTLLSSHSIPLDYGRLATDLRKLRRKSERQKVALTWGRDYARALRPSQ